MESRKLSGQLLHEIGHDIMNGTLKPGQVLPSVEALSEIKGVSRTVTREAFKSLSTLGLVQSQPKVGTVVRDRVDWQWWNPDVLRWSIDTDTNQPFLLQLIEVRLVIEPAAVALAAKNATEKDFVMIQESFRNLEQSVRRDIDWAKADYELHDSIIAASHNELILSLVRVLRDALLYSRRTTISVLKQEQQQSLDMALAQHKAVVDAVCSRDEVTAHQKMTELLQSVTHLIEKSDDGGGEHSGN